MYGAQREQSFEDLNQLIKRADEKRVNVCFVLLCLDSFQEIGDSYGYEAINQVLVTLEDYLRQNFRRADVLVRWSSGELILGLYGISSKVAARRLGILLMIFSRRNVLISQKHICHANFNIGVVEYPQDGVDLQTLYNQAYRALWCDKSAKHNKNH